MRKFINKKSVFAGIIAILLFVCIGCNFYTVNSYAVSSYFSTSGFVSAQLFSGDVLEQEITLAEGNQGVRVLMGTYVTVLSDGTVKAELYDEYGHKWTETTCDLTGTTDNQYVYIYFGDVDESLYGKKCKVRLTFENIDEQLIAVYASGVNVNQYTYTINGEEQNCNLVMDGIEETTYWEYKDFRLIYMLIIGIFASYMALFKINWKEISVKKSVQNIKADMKKNWKQILLFAAMLVGCLACAGVVEYFASRESAYMNPMRAAAVFVTLFVVMFAVCYKEFVWKKAHVFFFIVSMLVGTVNIMSVPETAVSWDEQIHYTKSTALSWGANGRISASDYLISSNYTISNYYDIFQKEQRDAWQQEVELYEEGMMPYMEMVYPTSVAYMPTSIALYIARELGFGFVARYNIGKFANLLMYSAFLALSIKTLKGRGKMIVASVGLIPTNIFLASTYGYDWWVTSLIILGMSMFIGELQEKGCISTKKMFQSVGVMCLGMLAKAVYFPVLFPMMLLKKDKYEESKKSRLIVVGGAVFLIASFLLPMLAGSSTGAVAGGGDSRGGDKVNAVGQVMYILANLGEFLNTLFSFLWDYLNPDIAAKFITQISYQGRGPYFTVALIIMAIAAFVDNSKETVFLKKNSLAKWGGYIGVLGAIVLVITALFVSYTPVGAHTVNGVQARYIIPVLFPFLYFVGENAFHVSDEAKGKVYSLCTIGMAILALNTIYTCLIVKY